MSHINKNWTIGLLLIVVAILFTLLIFCKIRDSHEVGDFISTLSSIISIILSIFAIFYSYHSIVESDRQGTEVAKTLQEIKSYYQNTKDNNSQLLQSVLQIQDKVSTIASTGSPRDTLSSEISASGSNKPKTDRKKESDKRPDQG